VWLGSFTTALRKALGDPSHRAPPWRAYDFKSRVVGDGRCDGGYDVLNWLDLKLLRGSVIELFAGQVTSC
jgi:hypothetical protein